MSKALRFPAPALVLALILAWTGWGVAAEPSGRTSGKRLYETQCGQCHGLDGEGFKQLYPPLRRSAYLDTRLTRLPCVIRQGLRGEIVTDGRVFNQIMPGNERLTAEDIEAIIAYMLASWGPATPVLRVEEGLSRCTDK